LVSGKNVIAWKRDNHDLKKIQIEKERKIAFNNYIYEGEWGITVLYISLKKNVKFSSKTRN